MWHTPNEPDPCYVNLIDSTTWAELDRRVGAELTRPSNPRSDCEVAKAARKARAAVIHQPQGDPSMSMPDPSHPVNEHDLDAE